MIAKRNRTNGQIERLFPERNRLRFLAAERGEKVFHCDPCAFGNDGLRYVCSGTCVGCVRSRATAFDKSGKRKRWPDERAEAQQKYLAKPAKREQHRCHIRNYRARKRAATGAHTPEDIEALMALQNGKCAYCKRSLKRWREVDHIVPLASGGPNGRSNLQLLCRSCNARKSHLDPIEFAKRNGMLV